MDSQNLDLNTSGQAMEVQQNKEADEEAIYKQFSLRNL